DKKKYVGRVIAMEGDDVTYLYDVLYRNNEIVPEDYLKIHGHAEYYTEDMTIETLTEGQHTVIPKGSYLILNDKRTDLRDSRQFGLISQKQIIGTLTFRLKPISQFGFIDNGLAQ
ncbi:MAG: signal peptidase I, partial [Streptococcus minor]|nr:signal peptidase I [Streptococcus minor]